MPTVSIRGTLIQWARVGATATTPRPTDTKFVVTEGTTLTVQATTVAPSTSSTQTGTAQTPATPAFTYTWCHSPPNPLIEASPATPTGTTTPSATTGNADPLQFLSGQGTNTAQFKFNKPGKYTVSCRIVGQDRCLGLSASSLPITVWVPRVDWDVDVNDDGQFTADEEALETDPVGIPMPVITLPADDTASSQNSGPAPLVYSNRIVLRRIYPNDVPRSLVKLKRNGGDFRIVRPDGTEVLQRGAAESADLWNDISGGDTNLLLQALDTQRFTLTLEYANDTPSSP
jgi:hypothetical protein